MVNVPSNGPRLNAVPVSADTLLGDRLLAALLTSMAVALTAAVGLGGDYVRLKLTARVSSLSISFWGGKWARRIATFAGFGLKPPERPAFLRAFSATEQISRKMPRCGSSRNPAPARPNSALPVAGGNHLGSSCAEQSVHPVGRLSPERREDVAVRIQGEPDL